MLKIPKKQLALLDNPITQTASFSWNIENSVNNTMNFQYYVGEGPLYWFRIDWYNTGCPSATCISTTPIISYIAPNCPYEIVDTCLILPPNCTPIQPTPSTHEVWHMLATSVIHLCERINQECCNRIPTGYIRRVQQYMQPALCCDVAATAVDQYVDVDFVNCECGNLVDPSIATVVYPCYVNQCGINGPAYTGEDLPPISTIKFAPDILDFLPMALAVSTTPVDIAVIPPVQNTKIANRFGLPIPNILHCKHNLSDFSILKSDRIHFPPIDLLYDNKLWRASQVVKNWKLLVEWQPVDSGYNLNLSIEKKSNKLARSRISLKVKSKVDLNNGLDILSKNSIVQSKLVNDEIGLFKNNQTKLNLKG